MKTKITLKTVLLLLWIGMINTAMGQYTAGAGSFDGVWAGVLKNSQGSKSTVLLKINGGSTVRYMYNEDTDKFEPSSFEKQASMFLGNNFIFTWMNKGGVWSETQTHMISYLKPKSLYCRLIRQVTNAQEDEDNPGINNEWSTTFEGILEHFSSMAEFERAMAN